jgi:hypothetical protein
MVVEYAARTIDDATRRRTGKVGESGEMIGLLRKV